jgi:hypothetical protein
VNLHDHALRIKAVEAASHVARKRDDAATATVLDWVAEGYLALIEAYCMLIATSAAPTDN